MRGFAVSLSMRRRIASAQLLIAAAFPVAAVSSIYSESQLPRSDSSGVTADSQRDWWRRDFLETAGAVASEQCASTAGGVFGDFDVLPVGIGFCGDSGFVIVNSLLAECDACGVWHSPSDRSAFCNALSTAGCSAAFSELSTAATCSSTSSSSFRASFTRSFVFFTKSHDSAPSRRSPASAACDRKLRDESAGRQSTLGFGCVAAKPFADYLWNTCMPNKWRNDI